MQSCFSHVAPYHPIDSSLPGSSVRGILQARMLEWVHMPSSRDSSWPRDRPSISMSSTLPGGFFTTSATWKDLIYILGLYSFLLAMNFCPFFLCSHSENTLWAQTHRQKETLCDLFLDYDIPKSKKYNINTKYLNNVIDKENLVDICQILFQRENVPAFWMFRTVQKFTTYNTESLNKVQKSELAANSSKHKI